MKAILKAKAHYGMSLSSQVHLANCYEHCRYFFQRCKRIHYMVFPIIYWVMLGYDPFDYDPDSYSGIKMFTEQDQDMLELKPIDKIPCSHTGFCVTSNLGFIDFLDLGEHDRIDWNDSTWDKSDHTAPYYTSSRSLLCINGKNVPRQVSQLIHRSGKLKYLIYKKPRRGTLGPFLQNVTGLSVLLLRNCEELRENDFDFRLHYFQSLTVLEISGSRHLTTIPANKISQLTGLLCLNLSHLPIKELPMDFFSNLVELRWVILRGCSKLGSLPTITPLLKLEVLDLSHCTALQEMNGDLFYHLRLQMLDLSYTAMSRIPALTNTPNLNHLSLSGCGNLRNLPKDLGELKKIKVLNLYGCSRLEDLDIIFSDQMSCLLKLDISETLVNHLPSFANLTNLVDLSLRGLHLDSLEPLASLSNLKTLDLSKSEVNHLPSFANLTNLVELSLGGLHLDSLEPLASLSNLKKLELSGVNHLPSFANLTNLVELSLTGLPLDSLEPLASLSSLKKLDLSKSGVNHLSSFANLTNLDELSLRDLHLDSLEPLASLSNLKKLVLAKTGVNQGLHLDYFKPLESLSNLEKLELHGGIVDSLERLEDLHIAHISHSLDTSEPGEPDAEPEESDAASGESDAASFKRNKFFVRFQQEESDAKPFKRNKFFVRFQQEYEELEASISTIQKKINTGCSDNANSSSCNDDRCVKDVIDTVKTEMNANLRYISDSINLLWRFHNPTISEESLNQLVKIATEAVNFPLNSANVKQWRKLGNIILKLKLLVPVTTVPQNEGPYKDGDTQAEKTVAGDTVNVTQAEIDLLDSSYKSLTDIQKNCLLCFSVFAPRDNNAGVFVIKKRVLIQWWIGEGFIDPDSTMEKSTTMEERGEGFTDPGSNTEKCSTVEEIGTQILNALVMQTFIQVKKHQKRESSCVCMQPFVRSFVTTKARERGFFDFNGQSKMLTPQFARSKRACLLKFYDDVLSYNIWADYTDFPKKLKSFETVRTLFNVNESVIDINVEWFSKMKNLSVLHLGNWHSENAASIDVVDQKFLKYLKKMKQLRLLNLQGLSPITKLPDSICKLVHLRVLQLRGCSSLAELPVDIGTLKNLIHLDITHCRLLSKLPKGLTLLLKLEVLKGFIISAGPPNRNICNFEDLVHLRNLRSLSLVARRGDFPNSEDLQVVYKMESLPKLKITWEVVNVNEVRSNNDDSKQQVSKGCEWLKQSCWARQPGQNDREEESASDLHSNLRKLVLIGFPHKSAASFLSPSCFQKLEELHVIRGNLERVDDTANEEHNWNIKTLHLKHLHQLKYCFDLDCIRAFPQLTYVARTDCGTLDISDFFDDEGVWIRKILACSTSSEENNDDDDDNG